MHAQIRKTKLIFLAESFFALPHWFWGQPMMRNRPREVKQDGLRQNTHKKEKLERQTETKSRKLASRSLGTTAVTITSQVFRWYRFFRTFIMKLIRTNLFSYFGWSKKVENAGTKCEQWTLLESVSHLVPDHENFPWSIIFSAELILEYFWKA